MKRFLVILGAIGMMSLGLSGCGQAENNTTANAGPKRESLPTPAANNASTAQSNTNAMSGPASFWNEAAIGGMAEVELGKLAASKAQNAEVKSFGQMMVTDHGKANDELKTLAAKKNISLPTDLDAKHRSLVDKLKGLSGADFDREYVEEMVEDHEMDVQKFESQSADASDPDAKAFAAKTLPTLRKHLDAIKAIQAKMK